MDSRPLTRVVWEEGMHLAQHHFQAQNRFFEQATTFTLSSLFFGAYGFAGLELDRESLLNGTVQLGQARGILPDGLTFHFPHDPSPAPLPIRDLFSPTQSAHVVHLVIPAYRSGGPNVAEPGDPSAPNHRFLAEEAERVDEVTGEDRKSITLARKNFRLVLDVQLAEEKGWVGLPVGRVIRDGRGSFAWDPHFIPPVLRIGAVPALSDLVHRVLDLVIGRSRSLRAGSSGEAGGIGAPDVAEMWLAHALHQALPALRHLKETRGAHPEVLYQELVRLGGALSTFSLDARPEDLPLYNHDDLGGCFGTLERQLRSRLEVVLPSRAYRVAMNTSQPPYLTAAIPDREAFHSAEFYVEIEAALPEAEIVARAPRLMKVCSSEYIERLVREAFPGLPMRHLPSPPAEVRPQPGRQVFQLEKTGPCWTAVVGSGNFGIYVPDALPGAKISIVVVPQG